MTKAEVAETLRVSESTVNRIVASGDIKKASIGGKRGRCVYRRSDVENYVMKQFTANAS